MIIRPLSISTTHPYIRIVNITLHLCQKISNNSLIHKKTMPKLKCLNNTFFVSYTHILLLLYSVSKFLNIIKSFLFCIISIMYSRILLSWILKFGLRQNIHTLTHVTPFSIIIYMYNMWYRKVISLAHPKHISTPNTQTHTHTHLHAAH